MSRQDRPLRGIRKRATLVRRSARSLVLLVGLLGGPGCRSIGEYVWVDSYKEPAIVGGDGYLIERGDLISVRVWNQDSMSARGRVRADGRVSLPFLNDVDAAGLEPRVLGRRVEALLKEFINNPVVTVALEEAAPVEVSVVGEVARPGVYRIEQDAGVLNALAIASGLTQYADRDQIFVLRRPPGAGDKESPVRIRFTYSALSRAEGAAAKFRLRKGDVVVVE